MFPDRDVTKLLGLVTRTLATGRTTLVAIDGLGGAGKSTLAAQLRGALDSGSIVAVDDFYRPMTESERGRLTPEDGFDEYFDWARLRDEVLVPLSEGSRSRYRRYDWVTNTLAEWHEIEPGGVVIAEGVYSTRPELRPYFDVTAFVETPREQRLARMLDRLYDDVAWVERWMAAEDWYLEHIRPGDHVDLVVDGSSRD
ncbi:MAG: uridine kinase [Chloroflexi bacterium]|nr:uridine kinase [Chloroflexota bacterium]